MEFAKCLKCGHEIGNKEIIEESFNGDGSEIVLTLIGWCTGCGQRHMWDEVFQYSYFENLHAMNN